MKLLNVQAILLDMDGTLVQSTSGVEVVWTRWCEHHQIPAQQVLSICHGVRSKDIILQVAPHLNVDAEIEVLNDLEIEYACAGNAIPGAETFLQSLMPYPWAVVTSASRRVALHRMATCNLTIPPLLIGSGDVVNGKPSPEPYQIAASRLGITPENCIVFEDALPGIQSAIAAGCRVIQVGGQFPLSDQVEAVIQDWTQIELLNMTPDGLTISIR